MRHLKNSIRNLNCMRILVISRDGRKGYTTATATKSKHPKLYKRLRSEWVRGNRVGIEFKSVSLFLV